MLIRLKCGRCCTLLQSLGKIRAFAIQELVKQPLIWTLKLCLTGRIEIKVLITLLFRFSLISSLKIKVENLKPTVGGELIFLPNEDLDLDNNNTRKKHYCTKYFSYIIAILLFFNVSDSSSYLNIRVFHKRTKLAIYWHYCQLCIPKNLQFLYLQHMMLLSVKLDAIRHIRIIM